MMHIDSLTLRPDRGVAAGWSFVSFVVIALGVWFVNDSDGQARMWILLGVMLAVSLPFVLQLVRPRWFEVHLGPDGIAARTAWQHLDIAWDELEGATIRTMMGESYLSLRIIRAVKGGWVVNPANILLPVGADVSALRVALARARAVGRMSVESQDAPA
jgi:hypothetical protein